MSDQHRWGKIRGFKWEVCLRCDLVALKNEATRKAMKKPCWGQLVTVVAPKSQNQKDAEKG